MTNTVYSKIGTVMSWNKSAGRGRLKVGPTYYEFLKEDFVPIDIDPARVPKTGDDVIVYFQGKDFITKVKLLKRIEDKHKR